MKLTIKNSMNDCNAICDRWNTLVNESNDNSILNQGISLTYEWSLAIEKCLLEKRNPYVFLLADNSKTIAILPTYLITKKILGVNIKILSQFSELHNTRSGLIVQENKQEHINSLIHSLLKDFKNWHSLRLILIENSNKEISLRKYLEANRIKYFTDIKIESPYFVLPDKIEDFYNSLDKRFLKNINSRKRKLEKEGSLSVRVFTKPSEVDDFLSMVYSIEKESWKEKSGTSITTNDYQKNFYDFFTPMAAKNDWLRGIVLFLNNTPIAYSYGILFNNVYEGLKTSYSEEYKKHGPGNILKQEVIKYLINNKIKYYDLLGNTDPIKMKWCKNTYKQINYTIFNDNIHGSIAYYISMIKRLFRRL